VAINCSAVRMPTPFWSDEVGKMRVPGLSVFRLSKTASAVDPEWHLFRWMVGVFLLCLSVTVLFIIGMSVWGVLHDLRQVRETLLEEETQRLRSHARRSLARIQDELHRNMP